MTFKCMGTSSILQLQNNHSVDKNLNKHISTEATCIMLPYTSSRCKIKILKNILHHKQTDKDG